MLLEALKLFGTVESPGEANNPIIMEWSKEVGVANIYSGDAVPWCGLFMAVVALRAGKQIPFHGYDTIRALSWVRFGLHAEAPMLGDVVVFTRATGGHVALYVGEDAGSFHVLGGNQSDKVCISRIEKHRAIAFRRPVYSIAQPPNVRRIFLSSIGELSKNEA